MPVTPYGPRHAAVPARTASAAVDEPIKAPGLAAYLRRSPHRVRQAAVGAIGAGVVLFVVASVATAAAGAGTKPAARAAGSPPAVVTSTASSAAPAPAAPVTARPRVATKELAAKPVTVAKQAPATRKVISGLAANGIPNVALNAYRVAAARMASALPSCGIDWAMLAGIGREESDHGRFAGAVLHSDGTSTPRIVGPALDGVHSDYIAAPANGAALDGDSRYTHALGPMQFIPQTWARYGADANGDGRADVFNINDAALGAARYLCAAGGNLRTEAGKVAAVLAYNHNSEYLAQVLALGEAYRTGLRVTGLPVGRLTGALPPIGAGGLLPVNPGAPTAIGATLGAVLGSGSSDPGTHASSAPKPGRGSSSAGRTSSPAGSSGSTAPAPARSSSTPNPGPGSSASRPAPSGSTSASPTGSAGAVGGSAGGSSSPTPSPTPTPTCKFGLGPACLIP